MTSPHTPSPIEPLVSDSPVLSLNKPSLADTKHDCESKPTLFKARLKALIAWVLCLVAVGLLILSSARNTAVVEQYLSLGVLKHVAGYLQGDAQLGSAAQPVPAVHPENTVHAETVNSSKEDAQIALFLSKKYRLAASEVTRYVQFAHLAAKEKNVEFALVMAVMSIESNLNPITESPMQAQGLMQVMTSVHLEKLAAHGGAHAVFDPQVNIRVGATILADCIKLGGSVEMGLKCYVGATGPTDGGYGAKVLAEKERIEKARLGQFDFTANNKVLIDMGILAANPAQSDYASTSRNDGGFGLNGTIVGSGLGAYPMAAPSPSSITSPTPVVTALPSVLPSPSAVTFPSPIPHNAGGLLNANPSSANAPPTSGVTTGAANAVAGNPPANASAGAEPATASAVKK